MMILSQLVCQPNTYISTCYYAFFMFNVGTKNALKLWQMLRVPVVLLAPNFPPVAFP
jgi:hypothetical protein